MFDRTRDGVTIRNIAIATDFSPWSDRATQHGLLVARQYGAFVHILHAVRRSEFWLVPDMLVPLDTFAEQDSENLIARLRAKHSLDNLDYRCWNLDGEVPVLADFVREHEIDLMVLGTRGRRGISKLLMGSVSEEISGCVPCPVLTVGPWSRRAAAKLELKNVLFATDLSSRSTAAMPYVTAAARMWGAGIHVLHVCSGDSHDCEQRMEACTNSLRALAGIHPGPSIRSHVMPGEPSSAILEFARQNEDGVIILGLANDRSVYGSHPLPHTYRIVCEALCPVLSVRSN